jgi:hypothetical protein
MIKVMEISNRGLRRKRGKSFKYWRGNRTPFFVVSDERHRSKELERIKRLMKSVCRRILSKPNTAILIYSNLKRKGRHVVWE